MSDFDPGVLEVARAFEGEILSLFPGVEVFLDSPPFELEGGEVELSVYLLPLVVRVVFSRGVVWVGAWSSDGGVTFSLGDPDCVGWVLGAVGVRLGRGGCGSG